jgi:hypothetical protein
MIPVSNTVTRQNYARRDEPASATLATTGRLTFNHKAAKIFQSFGIDKLYLSYGSKDGQRVISLSDTGEPGIIPYQLTFGHALHIKGFLNLVGEREAFFYTGKYDVELLIAEKEDTEKTKSSVVVKLTKVRIFKGGEA